MRGIFNILAFEIDTSVVRLEFSKLDKEMHLPLPLLVATTLNYTWSQRMSSSKFRTYQVRSEIEQTINLFRTSRLDDVSARLQNLAELMFQ